ncbi:MAG: hypothetical protein U0457_13870 [Candidatus Sericytochromatia bacterium]
MLKNIFSNTKKSTISVRNNSFDFNSIRDSKEKQTDSSPKEDEFYVLYDKAFLYIDEFYANSSFNVKALENASKCLVSSIELRPSKPKPYLLLAYIYFIIDNKTLSVKYMKIAEELDSSLPQIQQLRDLLNGV